MKHGIAVSIAVICGIVTLVMVALAQDVESDTEEPLIATARDLPSINVRGLDEPLNPFREQYSEWDRWFYAHPGKPDRAELEKLSMNQLPDNWVYGDFIVDSLGYPIPDLVALRRRLTMIANGDEDWQPDTQSVGVWGEMPLEMYERYDAARTKVYAQYTSVIPRWLAEAPPLAARIWPDGSVTTHGELGSYAGMVDMVKIDMRTWTYTSEPYCLYNSEGDLLRQTKECDSEDELFTGCLNPQDVLDGLFFEDWMAKVFQRIKSRGWQGLFIENDYYYVWDRNRNIVEVYDIDGTRYGPDFDMFARDSTKFMRIPGEYLPKLYVAQQELGIAK